MKYNTNVIRDTLSKYFTDSMVNILMKDMMKSQHVLNMRRQSDIEAFVNRNRNVKIPKESD